LACNLKNTISVIPQLLSFEYVENRGAIFGIMQGSNEILAVISGIICIVLVSYIFFQKRATKKVPFMWYMILAGGIGNLIDRIFRGYVVDMLEVTFIDYPVFNVADCFVTVGAGVLMLALILDWRREAKGGPREDNAASN
jgi:signal peptidase II